MKTVIVKDHTNGNCLQFGNVEKILVCSTDFILVMSNGTENRFIKPFYSYEVIEEDGTIRQEHQPKKELRLCFVDDKKALFHRWIEDTKPILKFNAFINAEKRKIIAEEFKNNEILSPYCDIEKQIQTLALVELENGQVIMVAPHKVRFADDKISEYQFDFLQKKMNIKENKADYKCDLIKCAVCGHEIEIRWSDNNEKRL